MKSLLFIIPIIGLLSFQSNTNERDPNLIYWDQRDLTWEDFKGKVPSGTKYTALTHSAINLVYSGKGTKLSFIVETIFYPQYSWKKKEANAYILKHEQGHFDITEYHTRLLRKDIAALKFKNEKNISKDVDKLFKKYYKAAEKMQDAYDKETNHSINKSVQEAWDRKISNLLKQTESYSGTKVVLDVSYLLF